VKSTRDLVGLSVFSVEEGRILGKTAECVVDLSTGAAVGLVVEVKPGEEMAIARQDITSVGKDAVMVASSKVLKPPAGVPGLAEHRTGGKAAPRILTRSGEVLGTLGTVHVDEKVCQVVSYEIVGDLMQAIADGPALVPVIPGTVHGSDAVVLPEEASKQITRPGGLRAFLTKAMGSVRETATEVGQYVSTTAGKVKKAGAEAGAEAAKKAKAAADVVEDTAGGAVKAVKARIAEKPVKKAPAKKAATRKAAPKRAPKKSSA